MSGHTPGPWHLVGSLPGIRHKVHFDEYGHGWSIAHVCNGDCAEENARLIAAAPELLEALIELAEAGEDAWGADRPCVRIAKQVIAKATGQ